MKQLRKLVNLPKRLLEELRAWSRPARVAPHAIADIRKTKTALIADNALLRQQLIVADRHMTIGGPRSDDHQRYRGGRGA